MIELENVLDLQRINQRDSWNILNSIWNLFIKNPMLTGMGSISKYIVYAISVHILHFHDEIQSLRNELNSLKQEIQLIKKNKYEE
jgi:hypothetical protein